LLISLDAMQRLLAALPTVERPDEHEVLSFIERHRLMGSGLGLIDVHLLASCLLAGVTLWTRDARLAQAAGRLGLGAK
jgi:predicted nucleic acid-binding protein